MLHAIKSIIALNFIIMTHSVRGMEVYPSDRVYTERTFENAASSQLIESYKAYVHPLCQGKQALHAAVIVKLRTSGEIFICGYDNVASDPLSAIQVPSTEDISIQVAISYNK